MLWFVRYWKSQENIPKAISNQKMNFALKEIGKLAGLDASTQVTKTRAGLLETHVLPKYKLITTHTARRSFATNAYLSGVSSLAIMKITGHKSESSFMKYIKGSQEENATALSKHPFFT
jgi:integrase